MHGIYWSFKWSHDTLRRLSYPVVVEIVRSLCRVLFDLHPIFCPTNLWRRISCCLAVQLHLKIKQCEGGFWSRESQDSNTFDMKGFATTCWRLFWSVHSGGPGTEAGSSFWSWGKKYQYLKKLGATKHKVNSGAKGWQIKWKGWREWMKTDAR